MKPGNIVFINGTSSSGKSTILHALQNSLNEIYLECGIDKFIWMMPERYLDRPLWNDVLGLANKAGCAGHQLVKSMHQAIKAISMEGINVLADHVLVESDWAMDCARVFSKLPAYVVGVYCPLDLLEAREKNRKNRTLGQARLQIPIIHAYAHYDLVVDTSLSSPQECADSIITRLKEPPEALNKMMRML